MFTTEGENVQDISAQWRFYLKARMLKKLLSKGREHGLEGIGLITYSIYSNVFGYRVFQSVSGKQALDNAEIKPGS